MSSITGRDGENSKSNFIHESNKSIHIQLHKNNEKKQQKHAIYHPSTCSKQESTKSNEVSDTY